MTAPKEKAPRKRRQSSTLIRQESNTSSKAFKAEQEKLPETIKVHPLCMLFSQEPPLDSKELDELREDIRVNGIKLPILVNQAKDTILDGRTRWMIAHEVGRKDEVPYDVFKGKAEEIPREILSRNVFRRHLNDDQRRAIIAKLRLPELEKEAAQRKKAGTTDHAVKTPQGRTEDQLAKEAKTTQHKARQLIRAHKAGRLDDVIARKTSLKEAAKQKQAPKPPKGNGKSKKAKPTEDLVEREFTLCLRRCHKHGSEHEVKIRLAEILFRVHDGDEVILPESVTYPGKGVYLITAVVKSGFRFKSGNGGGPLTTLHNPPP